MLIPIVPRAEFDWALVASLVIAGSGLGLLVSQLNKYTLGPISDERVSEAASANSAVGSFGLAFAGAIMLATLPVSFTTLAQESTVLPLAEQQLAQVLEDDAELMSNTQSRSCSSPNPRRSRTRSSGSTRTHDLSHFRWRCSFRSSPVSAGSSTRSA